MVSKAPITLQEIFLKATALSFIAIKRNLVLAAIKYFTTARLCPLHRNEIIYQYLTKVATSIKTLARVTSKNTNYSNLCVPVQHTCPRYDNIFSQTTRTAWKYYLYPERSLAAEVASLPREAYGSCNRFVAEGLGAIPGWKSRDFTNSTYPARRIALLKGSRLKGEL